VVVPFAAAGAFPIGSVMAADSSGKVKMATDADIGNLFGVLVQGRIIADLATEAIPTANVARRGTFRARSKCLSVFAPRRGISRDRSIFPPQFRHVAFKVASLSKLKRLHRLVLQRELPIKLTADHGASLDFYFDDPDGNMIEVYWPTGKHVKQPCLQPLDLSQSDEAILASIATETVLPTEIPF